MAPPEPLQVYVEKTTLTGNRAAPYLNPIETNRKGEATGVVFAVPLFSERNAFLVVRLPQSVAQDLARAVSDKPEAERSQFIRDWVKQNQLAIYDQYISSGGKSRRFRYDVIPVKAPVLSATPVRTPAQKPEEKAPIAKPAPEVKAPEAKPSAGRRLSIPDEGGAQKPAKPAEIKPPEVKAPEVKLPEQKPAGPIARAPVKVELPPLPSEVKGGNGSKTKPYQVVLSPWRESSGVGATEVKVPITLVIEGLGTIYFMVNVSASQLKNDAISTATSNLVSVCRAALTRYAAESNQTADNTALRDAMRTLNRQLYSVREIVVKSDADVAKYLGR
jgi:hypothetical protein